eukprot:GILK01003565.1.p1 GENE.GILK01003565.1~~GILK01003565.1.p1  ORF type:complete len:221 (-),score=34.72 GILK01003565.1:206-868(-)
MDSTSLSRLHARINSLLSSTLDRHDALRDRLNDVFNDFAEGGVTFTTSSIASETKEEVQPLSRSKSETPVKRQLSVDAGLPSSSPSSAYRTRLTMVEQNRISSLALANPNAAPPVLDVLEAADSYVIEVELPGIRSEDVRVTIMDGVLTISGEKPEPIDRASGSWTCHRAERLFGKFSRALTLPKNVELEDQVVARYENGVLRVELKRKANPITRSVTIS